jgi:DNA-binding beta-propeller fold protein YncE
MYILGAQYEYIFQYGLSSVFDLSTASYDSVYYDFNAQGTDGSGLAFSPDGTRMFVVTDSNNTVFQYSLSSGYDLSTVSYDSKSLTPSDTNPSDVRLNPDGSKIFIIGRSEDKVFEYATTQTTFVTTVKAGQAISATTINMKDLT